LVVCFDTSAINLLMADPDVERLTATLLTRYDVYITAINIAEIGKTQLPAKREALRAFEKRLAQLHEPLDVPNEILMTLTAAIGLGEKTANFGLQGERRWLWAALSEPNSVAEAERAALASWSEDLEASNRRATDRFRARVDEIFTTSSESRPKNACQFLRFYLRAPWPLIYWLPSQVFKEVTGRVLPLSRLDRLLEAKPSVWPLYLGGYVVLMYAGAVWQRPHGPPNNAGLLDVWSGVYLPFCDVFVTHDRGSRKKDGTWRRTGQYQALRVLNTLNTRKPRTHVLTWEQFRANLAG